MACIGQSVFGNNNQYIKFQGGDIVAIIGSNTIERFFGQDIRIPFKQIMKSRVILKAGQVNYLLNHLGLGDNATFLAIKATYDTKTLSEEKYILWNYYDDFSNQFPMSALMILTGNETNRIKQLYLTNPNANYPVTLDIMVASIDDTYNFFSDISQTGTTFTNLKWTDIVTYIVGQSLLVQDSNALPLIYLNISNINSVTRNSNIVTIDDDTLGTLLLVFIDVENAAQAHSSLSWILANPNGTLPFPSEDTSPPVVYFYEFVDNNPSNQYISFNGATGSAFSTADGFTFSTSLSLTTFGSTISKTNLISYLIDYSQDDRDGLITVTESNIKLFNSSNASITTITASGTYSLQFDLTDLALNNLSGVNMTLGITV